MRRDHKNNQGTARREEKRLTTILHDDGSALRTRRVARRYVFHQANYIHTFGVSLTLYYSHHHYYYYYYYYHFSLLNETGKFQDCNYIPAMFKIATAERINFQETYIHVP